MRIGISTWYSENYGSILQAYATDRLLKDMGHEPIFIQFDYHGGTVSKLISRIRILGVKRAISQYSTNLRGSFSAREYREGLVMRLSAMNAFIEMNFAITERCYSRRDFMECSREAEAFLCGSDQIWNPAITCYSPFYWLSFVPESVPKISYAPSMGMPKLGKRDKKFIVSQLNSFLEASVRESPTANMLNSLEGLNKHIETVVDPTLLLPKKHWETLCNSSQAVQDGDKYVFAYLLRGNSEQRAFCTKLAKRRGLKLLVYPCLEAVPQDSDASTWGDVKIYDDDPSDFLARIKGASLVITDSFHCTLFSILFHREFYVLRKTYDTASQTTRIDEILKVAGLENRVLERLEEPKDMGGDFSNAELRISSHAATSREYLTRAIAQAEKKVKKDKNSFGAEIPEDSKTVFGKQ